MIATTLRRGLLGLVLTGFTMSASQAAVEIYKPGDQNDPRVREARFLGEDKRHLSAAAELLKVQTDVERPSAADYPWLLADNYVSFGLRDRADTVYQALASTTDIAKFDRAQLKLAEFEYTRSYYPEARARLLRIRDGLPKELLLDWQDLTARVLMAMGKSGEAIDVLTAAKNGGDQTPYMRFNLAVALLKDGRTDQGRTLMEKVGGISPTDADTLALMDRANMTLGWNFLQSQQGAAARPILRKVRVEGLYSDRALLGLGWAELTQDGKGEKREQVNDGASTQDDGFTSFSTLGVLLRRGQLDDERAKHNFKRISGNSDSEEAMKAALQPWLTLIDRNPQDPAVQEAWLALPYSLDQIGAHDQAREYYEQAVTRLEDSRKRTELAMLAMKTNRMVETIVKRDLDAETGWDWELKDLPDAPETYYLQTLLAENRFSEALKNYRDMRLLARNLESWDHRLSDMEKTYNSTDRASVDPRELFARAMEGTTPEHPELTIQLTPETSLGEPGRFKRIAPQAVTIRPNLRLADLPPAGSFMGPYERIRDLRKRLASLLPNLKKTGDLQGAYLQKLGITELKAQQDQIEKYLVEARFALARLYDRQSISNDPDEYEIKKK